MRGIPTLVLVGIILLTILLLSKGADWMIDGAVHLALRTGLPKIVIGATILSLGTTAPEVFVSVMAAFMGNPGLALGNGVGSIIADTGLIFGLTILIAAPPLNRWILNRTGWWQLGSGMFLALLAGGAVLTAPGIPSLGRPAGLVLLLLLGVYLYMTYRWALSGKEHLGEDMEEHSRPQNLILTLTALLGGLIVVILASRLLVPAASETARRWGIPEDVIATTMIALGTSLPELSTAIAAIRRGHPEITIGNVVGADVLNALFVVGAAATVRPLVIPPTFFYFHFPAMLVILVSFRLFILWGKKGRFQRWQGIWMLLLYGFYVTIQYVLTPTTG